MNIDLDEVLNDMDDQKKKIIVAIFNDENFKYDV